MQKSARRRLALLHGGRPGRSLGDVARSFQVHSLTRCALIHGSTSGPVVHRAWYASIFFANCVSWRWYATAGPMRLANVSCHQPFIASLTLLRLVGGGSILCLGGACCVEETKNAVMPPMATTNVAAFTHANEGTCQNRLELHRFK